MATVERLPFELGKPSSNIYVTQASEIGYEGRALDRVIPTIDSEETDGDMAFSDENGNTIVLFRNGHIKTKNFDSSSTLSTLNNKVDKVANKGLSTNDYTTSEKNKLAGIETNAEVNDVETSASSEGVDYEIADENGHVLAQFKDGHIKTKEFDSSNITPTPSQDSPVDVESNEDEDFAIGDGEGYDILKVKNGHIKTKNFDSSTIDIASLSAAVTDAVTKSSYILPQITKDNRVYTYVHVGAEYTYQHVQDAINSITDASESKLYMVVIHDDIYVNTITQLRKESDPTQSLSSSDPYDTAASYIWMKDYVSLMGANGRQAKIEVHIPLSELETPQGETARASYVHCCYARGSFTMKDIFFRCSNTRYCIHQENGNNQTTGKDVNTYKEYINVKLEYLTGVNQQSNCMGVGLASNLRVLWENCAFIDHVNGAINAMHTHLNYPYPCEYTIRNCRIIGLNGKGGNQGFQDLCSGKRHKFVIEGCEMTSWQHVNGAYGSNLGVSDACHDVRNVGAKLSGHSNYACMGIVELPVLVLKSSVITDTIVVDSESSAYADLWGGNYKEYKGMVVGREYLPYSTSYKGLNMGTRLGNCSTTNKTLVVTINGTDITITFNRDYTDVSNTDIIAEINTALAGTNVVASNTFREQRLYFEDEVAFVKNTGSTPIQIDDFVSLNGSASVAVQTGTQNVYGIAAERIDPDEFGTIILKGKQKFKQLRGVNPSDVGVIYKVVDNALTTTTTQSEALFICTEKVSTYNVLEWAKNVL